MICANSECENVVDVDNLDICEDCFKEYFLNLRVVSQHPDQTALGDFE